jgi:hypothetical protein
MFGQSNTRALTFSLSAAATTSAFLGCVFSAQKVKADVVNLQAAQDATLFKESQGNSSSGPGMFVGTDGGGSNGVKHGLISFDIKDNIPTGATINSVSMTLYLGMVAGSGGSTNSGDATPRTIELHDALTSWHGSTNGASGITATGSPPNYFGGTGHGFTAAAGDATWVYASSTNTAWTTPGGDFSPTVSGSLVVNREYFVPSVWSSTNTGSAQMVADVQNWLNTPSSNDGWLLRNTDETDIQTFRAFFTREGAIEEGISGFQPMLTVNFTPVPEPTSLVLASGAATMLMVRRRRSCRIP